MIVIDMEMPKCCADCVFFVQLAGSDVTECIMPEGREGQWCPMDEVEPLGKAYIRSNGKFVPQGRLYKETRK